MRKEHARLYPATAPVSTNPFVVATARPTIMHARLRGRGFPLITTRNAKYSKSWHTGEPEPKQITNPAVCPAYSHSWSWRRIDAIGRGNGLAQPCSGNTCHRDQAHAKQSQSCDKIVEQQHTIEVGPQDTQVLQASVHKHAANGISAGHQ